MLATRPWGGSAASQQLRDTLSASVELLLQIQTWSCAPLSSSECRASLQAALKKLAPLCDANRAKYSDVMASAQQLQSLLCGSSKGAAT